MALSNTAVPKYYGAFRDAVIRGEIAVNEKVSMEMNRIDALIENPGVYYDHRAVDKYVRFCESELTLTDGSPLELLDSFKLWAEQIFGWYYYVTKSVYVYDPGFHGGHYEKRRIKRRLINRQYLIVGRGAAKSMYATTVQAYTLTCDRTTTQQVTTAPTVRQAEEVLAPFRTALARKRGPLFQFMTNGSVHSTTGSLANQQLLAATKKGIENHLTNSLLEIIPMSVDKFQGRRDKVVTIDEWLSGDIREDVVGAALQGAAKNKDYLVLAISSEGTVRNGPGDTIKMELNKILRGEYDDIHTSIWWYCLDSIDEVNDPAMWVKANPNLGRTVEYEVYQNEVERAENNPAVRNDTLAKRFGIPAEGYTYFFTYEETLPHRVREYWDLPCSMGADLSQGDDFCSFTFVFPLADGSFGIKSRNYITEATLNKQPSAMRLKYEEFIDEGSLIVMPGVNLQMMDVYDDLDEFILRSRFDVRTFGYDPYNATAFIERWCRENTDYGVEKVIQGSRTESVPLGELKNLARERMLLFDEAIVSFAMGNSVVNQDTNGNRKLLKIRYDAKIDPVAAMMDAYVAFQRHPEAFE